MKKKRLALAMALTLTFTSVYTGGLVSAEEVVVSEGTTESTAVVAEEAQSVEAEETPVAEPVVEETSAPADETVTDASVATDVQNEETVAEAVEETQETPDEDIIVDEPSAEEPQEEQILGDETEEDIATIGERTITIDYENMKIDYSGIPYGDEVELKVLASSTLGNEKLSYHWFLFGGIDLGTGDSCTIHAAEGTTYYCEVTDGNDVDCAKFWVSADTLTIKNTMKTEYTVAQGEDVTLTMEAETVLDNSLEYQWYQLMSGVEEPIKNATNASLKVETITRDATYRCIVTDGNERESADFNVSVDDEEGTEGVDSGLTAEAKEDYFYLDPGTSQDLSVIATARAGVDISYQWQILDDSGTWNDIDDAIKDTYSTGELYQTTQYQCIVSDSSGRSETVSFYIDVPTLTLDYGSMQREQYVMYGDRVEMTAVATSTRSDSLTYQWYRGASTEAGYMQEEVIDNATDATYIVESATDNETYICYVNDGNKTQSVSFYIHVDSGLTVKAGEYSYYSEPGVTQDLSVIATAQEGVDISYQWQVEGDDGNWEDIPSATSATYATENLQDSTSYRCVVSDSCGNSKEAYFYIHVRTIKVDSENTQTEHYVTAGNSETLTVVATSTRGNDTLKYQWSHWVLTDAGYSEEEVIDDATAASYVIESVTNRERYVCEVTDGNESEWIYFYVYVDSGLTAEKGEYVSCPEPGTSQELSVIATAYNGEKISYQWQIEGENWTWTDISDATSSTYTTGELQRNTCYRCVVSDEYGSSKEIYFNIWINTLTLDDEYQQSECRVSYGNEAILTVTAESTLGNDALEYQWYQAELTDDGSWTYNPIDDATEASYVVKAVTSRQEYECRVTDGNDTRSTYFDVSVDSGLSVEQGDYDSYHAAGKSQELSVIATAKEGVDISYQWQISDDNGEWTDISDAASSATYTTGELQRNTCYRCMVSDGYGYSVDVYFNIRVLTLRVDYESQQTDHYVLYGEDETLTVLAESSLGEGALEYQWYYWENLTNYTGEPIDGATGKSFEVKNVTSRARYACEVTDGNETEWAYFNVYVDSGLSVEDENYHFDLEAGESQELSVIATAKEGVEIFYRWQAADEDWNWEDIPDATTNTFTTGILKNSKHYICTVSDAYGNSVNVWFNINVSSLSIDEDSMTRGYTVAPGENVTLTMLASTVLDTPLEYQWYRQILDEEGGYVSSEPIEDVTGSSLQVENVTRYSRYECYVTDGNETKYISFSIRINSGLEIEGSTWNYYTVKAGDTKELSITAKANGGVTLSYQWQLETEDGWQNVGTSETYTYRAENIQQATYYYRCLVSDGYGYPETVYFELYVDTLTVKNTKTKYKVPFGESVTLTMGAESGLGEEHLQYQWYYAEFDEDLDYSRGDEIPEANGDSYTVENVTGYAGYICEVSDGIHSDTKFFSVSVDNGLTVDYDQNEFTVSYGGSQEMKVIAKADGQISYQWQIYEDTYTEDEEWIDGGWRDLPDATGDAYTATNIQGYTRYRCIVRDDYGYATKVDFTIDIENTITIEEYEKEYTVQQGKDQKLEVKATSVLGDGKLTYRWFSGYSGDEIEGETESSYIASNVMENETYMCRVFDGVSENYAYFHLKVDSGFACEAGSATLFALAPGETANLKVNATSTLGTVTYQWYEVLRREVYYKDVPDATGNTLTVSATPEDEEHRQYVCHVSDGYNDASLYFDVVLRDGLQVTAEETRFMVPKGGAAHLAVTANTADAYKPLHYEWQLYQPGENDGGTYETVGMDSPEYVAENVSETAIYRCKVSDQYTSQTILFLVSPQGGMDQAQELTLDHSVKVEIAQPGDEAWLQFTPSEMSWYVVDYRSNNEADVELFFYNDTDGYVRYNWGQDGQVSNTLIAGHTYYIRTKFMQEDQTGQYTVSVKNMFHDYGHNDHTWIQKQMITEPTCTENGTCTYVCSSCGVTKDGLVPARHTWDEGVVTKEATSLEEGIRTYTCTVCQETKEETIPVTEEHSWNEGVVTKEATCGETGTRTYTCDICKKTKDETIPATGVHKMVEVIDRQETCGADGSKHEECSVCGGNKSEAIVIPATGNHTWDEGKVTQEATCLEDGIKTYTCTVCEETKEESIQAPGHHTWDEGEITQEATCLEDGIRTYTCTVCEETKEESIQALGHHTWDEGEVTQEATCLEEGIKTYTCTECGEEKEETIAALGRHTYGAWKVTKAATALAKGTQVRTCSACGDEDTKEIAKLTATMTMSASSVTLKTQQSTTVLKVTGMATGDYLKTVKVKNGNYATVSNFNKNGTFKLTAKNKVGSTTLTITLASGKTGTVTVKVQKAKVATSSIKGVAKTLTLAKGKTATLKPSLVPITSQDKITYSSSNKKVATVSAKGVIKGVKAGKAKITVKAGKKSVTCTVTVTGVKTTKITGVKTSATIKKGKTLTLKAKVTPSNSDEKITYTSSNKKVATVSTKGVVKGVKKGTAVITVKSGSKKVTCKVTVK